MFHFYSIKAVLNKFTFLFSCFMVTLLISANSLYGLEAEKEDSSSVYLQAVQTFANNILKHGIDRYGSEHSPLFVDGIAFETQDPVRWDFYEGESWVLSNFASQQNLMRVLYGLTEMTGVAEYKQAAADAVNYMFEHQSDSRGLLYWGGHQFVDLETLQNQFKDRPHELKNNYPFYEFLYEVNPTATSKMLRAMWNAHILDWSVLDLNRHGEYDLEMGQLWGHEFVQQEPFFEGRGLTFINSGTDMIQSAMALYFLEGEEEARIWGKRLYKQYVRARHPETGLGVYQYSQTIQRNDPPEEGPLEGEHTYSGYGDRAKNQFGEVYGDIALEGNVLWGSRVGTIYGKSAVMLLHLSEQLEGTETGEDMLTWTLDGLRALSDYAYEPNENIFRPMWTDGTDLSDEVYPRTGYYGEKGSQFSPYKPEGPMMISYARAVRLSNGEAPFWRVTRHMFMDENLGDPGTEFKSVPELNLETEQSNPDLLVAVLEIARTTGQEEYLELAKKIGHNIIESRFHNGYFLPSPDHKYVEFDTPEPLALLLLEATIQGNPDLIPPYLTGSGTTDGEKFVEDIDGRPSAESFYEEIDNE